MYKLFGALLVLLFIASSSFAQQEQVKIRPIRLGVKVGTPNIGSINVELLSSIFNHKLAIAGDYGVYSQPFTDASVSGTYDFSYWAAEVHLYLRKPGKGAYLGLGYGHLNIAVNADGYTSAAYLGQTGSGTGEVGGSFKMIKLGAKWGGLIYFRPEIGYSFVDFDDVIKIKVKYATNTIEQNEKMPPVNDYFKLVFNLGIGIAF